VAEWPWTGFTFRSALIGYPALRSELLIFPAGKHDDQVDALGLIGQVLDRMTAGQKPKVVEPMPASIRLTVARGGRG
jgi:hypothetical protein